MVLEVLPALESDVPALMEVQFSAFEHDPYHEALYPGDHHSPAVRRDAADRTLAEWRAGPTARFLKCVERIPRGGDVDEERIIGYAKWNCYEAERPPEQWAKRPPLDWCANAQQKEAAETFLYATCAMREKTWGGRPHLLLAMLCVHRDHQRRGAGTLLVQWGLERAARLRLPAYLEASEQGEPLYRKLGFHDIDTLVIKAAAWGGAHDKRYAVMLKDPEDESGLAVRGELVGTEQGTEGGTEGRVRN